eukprot:1918985-Pyramimonas_sp.AAC.1
MLLHRRGGDRLQARASSQFYLSRNMVMRIMYTSLLITCPQRPNCRKLMGERERERELAHDQ